TRYIVLLPVPPATAIDTAPGYWRSSVSPVTSTALPARTMSCSALRPLSGRPTICACGTTVPMPMLRVSTSVASATTLMVSVMAPIFIVTLTDRVLPTASVMPVCSNGLKPCSFDTSLYGPTGRFVNTKPPSVPVTAVRVTPVSVWVTVTTTPGSAPPVPSITVPDNWATATVWALARSVNATAIIRTNHLPRPVIRAPPSLTAWYLAIGWRTRTRQPSHLGIVKRHHTAGPRRYAAPVTVSRRDTHPSEGVRGN